MGTQTRLVSGMDGTTDGLPFDPTIRIPPIQDPSPLQVISSHRPSPLEPSAADGNRSSNVRLDSRSKALAAAQPLGGDSPIRPLDTSRIASSRRATQQEEDDQLGPRKRQRVDYVQLPQPQKPNQLERNTSLDTIPRVNQLHEPPPSAARFPPILTNGSPHISKTNPRDSTAKSSPAATRRIAKSQANAESPPATEEPKKAKRNYTRGRRMWTDEETDALLSGVARYGVGKWKRILNDPDFKFPSDRTAVDLKDRYRTCRMHEERKIERQANGEPAVEEPAPAPSKGQRKSRKTSPPDSKEVPAVKSLTPTKAATSTPKSDTKTKKKKADESKLDEQQPGINFASVNTIQDMAEELAKKAEPTPPKWSAEDDANLSRGFQKHGFHWTAISKDAELSLQDRTGPQLRDRFRIKFPIHYQSSVPIELPDRAEGYDRDQRRKRMAPRGGTKVSLSTDDGDKNGKKSGQPTGRGQRSKNMSISDIIKPADTAHTPRITKTSLPSMQSLCAQVDAQPLPEPSNNNGAFIDIQPLPEEDEEFDESEYDNEFSDFGEGEEQSPADDESVDEYDDIARPGEDVRHLGILGLLNETDTESVPGHRLPPFKSTYDDTHEDWAHDVTLPPLLLEAPRPMFELD